MRCLTLRCYLLGLFKGVRIFTNLYLALENTDMSSSLFVTQLYVNK